MRKSKKKDGKGKLASIGKAMGKGKKKLKKAKRKERKLRQQEAPEA